MPRTKQQSFLSRAALGSGADLQPKPPVTEPDLPDHESDEEEEYESIPIPPGLLLQKVTNQAFIIT